MDRYHEGKMPGGNCFAGPRQWGQGPSPCVVNLTRATRENQNYRTVLWTGCHLQLTLMSIPVCGEIGLEVHPDTDQFLRIEQGNGVVVMGSCREHLDFQQCVSADDAIFVPAGTWHNVVNTGRCPLKLYSIYAPPAHPRGAVQRTKEEAEKVGL